MEVNLILFLLLALQLLEELTNANSSSNYKKEMHVAIAMYTGLETSRESEIHTVLQCAFICENNACLSFAYTKAEQKCDTYSVKFKTEHSGGLTNTEYFSKEIADDFNQQDCSNIDPSLPSGVYQIYPTFRESIQMYCDLKTVGGPWTVIQNRYDGSEEFRRNWTDYKNGFGNLDGEFWIGNEVIHSLTQANSVLRIELETFTNITAYAEYSQFSVADEIARYKLLVNGFSGNVSQDAMAYHTREVFSTIDQGITKHCAQSAFGGWWYSSCYHTNLNGKYTTEYWNTGSQSHVSWKGFPESGASVPLKKTRMMIRPTPA